MKYVPKTKKALWTTLTICQGQVRQLAGSKKPSERRFKRSRPRPRSKAMEKRMVAYRKQKAAYLKAHPKCEVSKRLGEYPERVSTEVHHRRGRGKFLLDESTWMAVSAYWHERIHRKDGIKYGPEWAYANGFLVRRT